MSKCSFSAHLNDDGTALVITLSARAFAPHVNPQVAQDAAMDRLRAWRHPGGYRLSALDLAGLQATLQLVMECSGSISLTLPISALVAYTQPTD